MARDSNVIGSAEIDELLKQADGAAIPLPAAESAGVEPHAAESKVSESKVSESTAGGAVRAGSPANCEPAPGGAARTPREAGDDIQYLLDQAEAAIASVDNPSHLMPDLTPFLLQELAGAPVSQEKAALDVQSDVELDVKIELGRTHMHLDDVLKLRRGSVVSLDRLARDPVDVYVNGRLIARGEVLVLNDNFCVRVAELVMDDEPG